MTLPGKSLLTPVVIDLKPGEKCEHKDTGQWVILWEGKYYVLKPRDTLEHWTVKAQQAGADPTQHIRWYCQICNTVQE